MAQVDVELVMDKVVVIEGGLTVAVAEMEVEVSRLAEHNFNRGNVRAGTGARQARTRKSYLQGNASTICRSLTINVTCDCYVHATPSH